MVLWVETRESFGRGCFTGVIEGVTSYVVVLEKFLLEIFGEIIIGCSGVCIFGRAARPCRRELVCLEDAVASSSGVEGAINVEEIVALIPT